MNQLSIIGFIGRDAEVKSLPNGTPVTKFSVATNKAWLDEPSGEWKSKTQWHYVSFFGERFAENVAGKLVVDPIFWTRKQGVFRWRAALNNKESQCLKQERITHPA